MTTRTSRPGEPEYSLMPGARDLRLRSIEVTPELLERRAATAELGDAMRELLDAAVSSEADPAVLRAAAAAITEAAEGLRTRTRTRQRIPLTDDLMAGVRMFNPAIGPGNAIAPPLVIEIVDGKAVGSCTLGLAYEGPHMFCHGGVSAMLLDQILGHAVAAIRSPGMTVELTTRYRRPVPLQEPLRLVAEAWIDGDQTVRAKGAILLAADPDGKPLVQATARFATLRPDQAMRIFAGTELPPRVDPEEAHD